MVSRFAPRTRLAAVSVLALAATAGLGACGGSGSAASQTTSPPTSAAASSGGTRASAFASCMESKGIPAGALTGLGRRRDPGSTVPGGADGQGGSGSGPAVSLPPGVSAQQFRSAFQACRSQLPGGFGAANSPAFAAYRNCLALHGYTLPARGPGATPPTTTVGETATTVSAATRQAAMTACAALRPARPSTSTTTPTGA